MSYLEGYGRHSGEVQVPKPGGKGEREGVLWPSPYKSHVEPQLGPQWEAERKTTALLFIPLPLRFLPVTQSGQTLPRGGRRGVPG